MEEKYLFINVLGKGSNGTIVEKVVNLTNKKSYANKKILIDVEDKISFDKISNEVSVNNLD